MKPGCGCVEQRTRLFQGDEYVGECCKRADAVRDCIDRHACIVNLGRVAKLRNAEVGEIGVVDRN